MIGERERLMEGKVGCGEGRIEGQEGERKMAGGRVHLLIERSIIGLMDCVSNCECLPV